MKKSCVYVMYNKEVKRTKIGFAFNVEKRLNTIMNQSGCVITLKYKTKQIEHHAELESILHFMFQDFRGIGEWFNIEPDVIINRIKNIYIDESKCRIVSNYKKGLKIHQIVDRLKTPEQIIVRRLIQKGFKLTARQKRCLKSNHQKPKENLSSFELSEMVRKSREKLNLR